MANLVILCNKKNNFLKFVIIESLSIKNSGNVVSLELEE